MCCSAQRPALQSAHAHTRSPSSSAELNVSGRKRSLPENQLLAALPAADRRRLLANCDPVELVAGDNLTEPGDVTRHAFFPIDSFISLIAALDGAHLEVGLVGNEGMVGSSLILGVPRFALARAGAGRRPGVAARCCHVHARARAQPGAAAYSQPLPLRDAGAARTNGRVHAVSFRRGAARALVAHDTRSSALERVSNHARVSRLHAGRAAGGRDAGRERAATTRAHSIHAAAASRFSTRLVWRRRHAAATPSAKATYAGVLG